MSEAITRATASTNVQVRLEKYLYILAGIFFARDEWILSADVVSIYLPACSCGSILVEFHTGARILCNT
jgi:hypothetical protein